jgi:hypothetical protein
VAAARPLPQLQSLPRLAFSNHKRVTPPHPVVTPSDHRQLLLTR